MELIQSAMQALKAGNKSQAREIILKVLEQDENNEQAWLIMAGAVDDPMEQRICLENVLHLNPQNQRATQGLQWMHQKFPHVFEDQAPAQPVQPSPPTTTPAYTQPIAATGPTTVLEQSQPLHPPVEPTQPAQQPTSATPVAKDDLYVPNLSGDNRPMPCPECGTPTTIKQRRCPKCRRTLVQRVGGPKSLSMARIAGILGIVHAVLTYVLLGGGLLIFMAAGWSSVKSSLIARGADQTYLDNFYDQNQLDVVFNILTVLLFIGIFAIVICVNLMKGRKWAYWTGIVFYGFHFIIYTLQAFVNNAALNLIAGAGSLPTQADSIINILKIAIFVIPLWMLAILILLALSYTSFTGKLARIIVDEDENLGNAEAHFDRGVSYRRTKYWYMAMREWEKAVALAPSDPTYHHALGLMYEHMKRPADALREFEAALQLAPDNTAILQDRQRLAVQLSGRSA